MQIEVRHTIRYEYDRPVFVEPHILRLRPLSNSAQQLTDFRCQISPTPQLAADTPDAYDNDAISAWFVGTTDSLEVVANSAITTLRANPFNYILDLSANSFETLYDDGLKPQLLPYLAPISLSDDDSDGSDVADESDLRELEQNLRTESEGVPINFVQLVNNRLRERIKLIVRPDGDPWPPLTALRSGAAACRDIVLLAMSIYRRSGIASRFVSGYALPDDDATEHYMHAWTEVYLPGAGWRGYDPTSGLAVADQHVVVARAASPADAAPVTGTVRGDGAVAKLETKVRVEARD